MSTIFFYKPEINNDTSEMLKYGGFILSKNDEPTVDALRAGNFTKPIPMYMRSDAIQETADKTVQPNSNQVAYNKGDWQDISTNHKSWFLLDGYGHRIPAAPGTKYWMMDWANKDWQLFWIARARGAILNGGNRFTGVFCDNVECSLAKRQRVGPIPARYTTDAEYQAAVKSFLTAAKSVINPVYGNIIERRTPQIWFDMLAILSGGMDECWAVDWNNGYLSVADWLADIQMAQQTQNTAILVSQGDQTDTARQQFCYASYLLVAGSMNCFRYSNATSPHYRESWWYATYDQTKNLGNPHSPMMQNGTLYFRLFDNGYVEVDPVNHVGRIVSAS